MSALALASHVLAAYDDTPGANLALNALLPRHEMGPLPALVLAGILAGGCTQTELIAPPKLAVVSDEHEHDAAIGQALYVCIQEQRGNPRLFHSFDIVWREIQVGRDFAGVSAACVPSAALLSCQGKQVWDGVDKYFQKNPKETCTTVAATVDLARNLRASR